MATDTQSRRPFGTVKASQVQAVEDSSVSWRAIFAGMFIALLTYLSLISLGVAVGSSALEEVIRGQDTAGGLGWGSGIWFVVSALASLFVGSYCASRVSGPITTRIGRIQGGVITALFFAIMLSQIGSTLGFLGRGLGSIVGAVGGAAGDLSQNPQVQDTIDQAIGDLNLRASPEVVAQGVAVRLLRGNGESAKNYLARQAGISPAEADQRLTQIRQNMDKVLTDVGSTAAKVASIAGWSLFGALVLGSLFSMLGGGLGAQMNLRAPLSHMDEEAIHDQKAA